MTLRIIEVTICNNCPFMNNDSNHLATHEYTCNANKSKEIENIEDVPEWCELIRGDIIEVKYTT